MTYFITAFMPTSCSPSAAIYRICRDVIHFKITQRSLIVIYEYAQPSLEAYEELEPAETYVLQGCHTVLVHM
jgi:hypothetical protein